MENRRIAFFLFAACSAAALFLSFAYPVYNVANVCEHSADYFLRENKPRMEAVFNVSEKDFSLTEHFFKWFPKYRMNCDATSFLFLGKTWPLSYYERNLYIDHPLYNFLAFLIIGPITLISGIPSYAVIFSVFIVVNYALLLTAAWFLYDLAARLFSPRVGLLSGLLLIFSPFTHQMFAQPTSAGTMELFVVSMGCWLIYQYAVSPSTRKLVIYSLLLGILMLGKQVVALSFFALFLAFYYRRYWEWILFAILYAIPTVVWYAVVRFGFHLPYFISNITTHRQGVWLLDPALWEPYRMLSEIMAALPNFMSNLVYGFLLLPVLFAGYGLYFLIRARDPKALWAFLLSLSFLCLFFIMHLFRPSLSFLLFPAVLPLAALALLRLPKPVFYPAMGIILLLSQINFHLLSIPGVF